MDSLLKKSHAQAEGEDVFSSVESGEEQTGNEQNEKQVVNEGDEHNDEMDVEQGSKVSIKRFLQSRRICLCLIRAFLILLILSAGLYDKRPRRLLLH